MSLRQQQFDATPLIDRLERGVDVLPALARVASPTDARWKPPPSEKYPNGAWSILEICVHMLFEEVEDFRARIMHLHTDPAAPWPKIDPEGHAAKNDYNSRELEQVLSAWVRERRASVAWLRSLVRENKADWFAAYNHPTRGPVRAGVLLVSWPAHDALHFRQISKRLYELSTRDGQTGLPPGIVFETEYAGPWGA